MAEQYKTFKRNFWVQKEDNLYTVGLNEDGLEDFEKILSVDLPNEGESVDGGAVCGSIDTDKEPLDLYAPVTGTVSEINSLVMEDPTLIQDDPYDVWLFKIESDEDLSDDEDEEDEDLDDEDEDEDDDFEDDEEEEE